MEQPESNEPLEAVSASANSVPAPQASPARPAPGSPAPLPCPTCGVSTQLNPPSNNMTTSAYVYALGRIEPRFPRLSVEKEYAQATGRAETAGLTDRQTLQTVLSQPENRYLARQLCYVLTIEGLDTYILQLGDPVDLQVLIESPAPHPATRGRRCRRWTSRAYRSTGIMQRPHGSDCDCRPDLFIRPGIFHQIYPAAGKNLR